MIKGIVILYTGILYNGSKRSKWFPGGLRCIIGNIKIQWGKYESFYQID